MRTFAKGPLPASNERQTRTTQVRHGDALAELIETASGILAVDKSTFIRAALEQSARDVIEQHNRHVLTDADAAAFMAAMDRPAAPSDRLRRAANDYRTRIDHGD